jgi:hypothetical protein
MATLRQIRGKVGRPLSRFFAVLRMTYSAPSVILRSEATKNLAGWSGLSFPKGDAPAHPEQWFHAPALSLGLRKT